MTMDFGVADTLDLQAIEPGQGIHFMMHKSEDGRYVIDEVHVQAESAADEAHQHD